ncbi:MAG: glycogen synthase GlgA [Desulfarculaceae bacterium]|nr:glycogen synthase GlgA [Desulfarculaceae bacterium]MCF8065642.1 glycogen synthase GlgA [Desulfarculaceae bacterium]MCF8099604.1 glycogen synthase GlgA [Desulfarculaceae bacterium]
MPDNSPKVDKVLFVTPEVTPLAKTGGLGDVAAGLPPALAALGMDLRLVMPLYGHIDREPHDLRDSGLEFAVPVAGEMKPCRVWQGQVGGCPVYLLGNEQYFSRPGLYGDVYGDFGDNLERFVFLCRGAVELARALDWPAQVVHAHDWQTALLPAYLATRPFDLGPLEGAAGIVTIHNLAFQGIFPRHDFHLTGLPHYMDNVEGAEYWGNISLLKAGLTTAGAITTVSPTYADEIQTTELGMGMEGLLRRRSHDLHGIINGVDYAQWSPDTDTLLPATYSAVDLGGKAQCRQALLEAFGLEATQPDGLLMGFIGRLTSQKGVSLIAGAGEALLEGGASLALLGTGDADLEAALGRLAARHPGRVGLKLTFSEHLAHLLQGGSDLMLMPSRFEPCGLNQMYALRYGTPPLVHATGGLKDTVTPYDPAGGRGTGFVFSEFNREAFLEKAGEARRVFAQPEAWRRLMHSGMAQDFSWTASARRYLELYQATVQGQNENG